MNKSATSWTPPLDPITRTMRFRDPKGGPVLLDVRICTEGSEKGRLSWGLFDQGEARRYEDGTRERIHMRDGVLYTCLRTTLNWDECRIWLEKLRCQPVKRG